MNGEALTVGGGAEKAQASVEAEGGKRSSAETVAVLARWFLGGVFLYMGVVKALHPEEFLTLVRQYNIVSVPFLLNSIAALLPWFEIFCGLLMVTGVAVRGTALMLLLMLAPFTVVILRRALAVGAAQSVPLCAVEFDCGCGTGVTAICPKLMENCLLMFVSGWLLRGRGRKFSLRFSLLGGARSEA